MTSYYRLNAVQESENMLSTIEKGKVRTSHFVGGGIGDLNIRKIVLGRYEKRLNLIHP